MSDAGTISFSELAEVNPRVSLQAHDDDLAVSFVPMSDVSEGGKWTTRQERRLGDVRFGYTAFLESDLLFAKITPCMENGKGAHVTGLKNGIGCGSTEFHVLRAKEENSARYLHHWLQASMTRTKAIAYMGGSAGQQRVQPQFFDRYRVPKLSPTEQCQAANILDTADEAIAKTEAVIAKLRQVRTGLIHDLLTSGLDENGHLRDPIANPEQFQDTRLGQSPLSWRITPLSLLCSHIGSGVTPRGGQDVYKSTGILFIRSQNVAFEGLLLDDVAFITPETHIGMLRSEIFAHDVLYNITGASIGRCCPMPEGLGVANVNQHVCALRVPNSSAADAKFLATFLSSSICQRQLDALLTVGNRQGLNYQQLGSFMVPWPEVSERERISEQLWTTDSSVTKAEDELAKLRLLKSGLMDDLLTGRVRVPENT